MNQLVPFARHASPALVAAAGDQAQSWRQMRRRGDPDQVR
jgi:hypothetical protein